jgi:hypothetical protein
MLSTVIDMQNASGGRSDNRVPAIPTEQYCITLGLQLEPKTVVGKEGSQEPRRILSGWQAPEEDKRECNARRYGEHNDGREPRDTALFRPIEQSGNTGSLTDVNGGKATVQYSVMKCSVVKSAIVKCLVV